MDEVLIFLKWLGALPFELRTMCFLLWVGSGFLLAYATPFYPKEKEAEPAKKTSPVIQQNFKFGAPEALKEERVPSQPPVDIQQPNINRKSVEASGKGSEHVSSASNYIQTRNIAGDITVHVFGGTNTINFGDLNTDEKDYSLQNGTGGDLKLKVYLLFNSAAWSKGSSSSLISHKNRELTLNEFLEGGEFRSKLSTFQAIVCLGLASGQGNLVKNLRLSDERAVHLCGQVSRAVEAITRDIAVYGLALSYNKTKK